MNSKSYFINAAGKLIRAVENEAIQTFYVMTKNPPSNIEPKVLTNAELLSFIERKPEDYTFEFLVQTFGNIVSNEDGEITGAVKSKYNLTDIVNIRIPYVGFTGKTTLGRLVYTKIIVEGCGLENVLGFINMPITEGVNGKNEKLISNALMENEISVDQMYQYVDTRDWLGLQFHSVVTTSFTLPVLKKPKEVEELHKQLLKKYETALDNHDEKASEEIEKQLIEKTKEVLKDDVGMDLYLSGARGSIGNNMKNINLTRGAVKNVQTGKYDIIKGSLMDGLDKKDIAAHSNSILLGAYSKAVGTQVSGYLAKELSSALQTEVLEEDGSDCGTKQTLSVTIPKKIEDYLYRYIVEDDGSLTCLTPEKIDKYVGKRVKMRSPMYCIGKHLCSRCAGEYYYKLGKQSIGLTSTRVATTCTRLNMKKFHENLVKSQKIDLNDILL